MGAEDFKKYLLAAASDMEHGLGAHGSMGNGPSFFEFVASQALEGVVQPALQHMTLVSKIESLQLRLS